MLTEPYRMLKVLQVEEKKNDSYEILNATLLVA